MAERLPFGEIRPGARPLGSFLSPAQQQTAGAARPTLLDAPSGITTLQRASAGSVQGFNQFEQVATALAPFSRNLQTTLEAGIGMYANSQIEAGYYAELKNQQARAALSLQLQQEQGAANAAGQITQIEKVDPVGAQLMKEANPFKAIGRRRALAQLAANDIESAVLRDFDTNGSQLAALAPGSTELMARRAQISQGVLDKYGLQGDELESQFYVTPKLNQAWDKYTAQHRTLYTQELKHSTIANGTAALGARLQDLATNGIPFNGQVIGVGDPTFAQLAGRVLTGELDKQLSLLGGNDKAEAIKQIREQLTATFGQVPILGSALTEIRGGNSKDDYDKRPTWGASNPLDMLELTNRGNGARLLAYEQGQKGIEVKLDELWDSPQGPGSMVSTSDPNFIPLVREFRARAAAAGYRDIDGYIKRRMDSQESVVGRLYAPDPLVSQDFITQIEDLPRSAFSTPQAVQALREQARQAARAEPTQALQAAKYKEYLGVIAAKQKQATETTPGLQQAIDKALLQDLGLPQVKPLVDAAKAKSGGGNAFAQALQGAGAMAAAQGLGNDKITAFTQRLNNLFLRNAEAKIDRWMAERPGVPLTSSARNVLISEAIAETRKSEEYKQAFSSLTGKNPGQVGPRKVGTGPSQGTTPGPAVRGVERRAASSLPDTTVKGFAVRPVMNGDWLYGELQSLSKGKPVSADLYRLANRAGTTTNRYLLEQLRFYPQLDPNGEAQKFLEEKIRQQRQGQTVSQANWQSVVGSIGNSLMGVQPATAGTMPVQVSMSDGFQYSGTAPGGSRAVAMPTVQAPTRTAAMPLAVPQARTGPMPTLGNGAGGYNPMAPGSWLMSMIMPVQTPLSLPAGGDGDWATGPAVAVSHADSGSGYTIPGAKDAYGRPPVFSQGGANAFAAMMRDSGGLVKASDIASSQRSQAKNRAVGGAEGSHHLSGNAMDIHGSSIEWIRKHGAKYGWYVHDYDGSHGGHVEFRGGGTAARGRGGAGPTGNAAAYLKRLSYLETRLRNVPNAEGSGAMGYFQAMDAFNQEATAAAGGISPRDSDYGRASKATWAWIEKYNPRAATAIKAGRYDEADRLLRNTWPSLPGGSQAQSDQVQREARRYLGGA